MQKTYNSREKGPFQSKSSSNSYEEDLSEQQPVGELAETAQLNRTQILNLQRTHGNQAVLRMLAEWKGSALPASLNDRAIQRKVIKWDNPVLKTYGVLTPTEGQKEGEVAAAKLNDAVEKAAKVVSKGIKAFTAGTMTAVEVRNGLTTELSTGHVKNFVNKLIDWKATKKKKVGVKQAAGYIIEGFADKVAISEGYQRQYRKGGAIPDYRVKSLSRYSFNGISKNAGTLLDATSETEALKGHILGKLNNIGPKPAMRHPHLYDIYYDDLGIDSISISKKPIDLNDPLVQQRLLFVSKRASDRAVATKNRKESLRKRKRVNYSEVLKGSSSRGVKKPTRKRTRV